MSKTAAYEVDTIDADELTRFFKTYSKAYLYIEQALLMLELDATDQHQFASLHSAINSIEQAIQDIGFNELVCLTSTLNKMVDSISSGDIRYQTAISRHSAAGGGRHQSHPRKNHRRRPALCVAGSYAARMQHH